MRLMGRCFETVICHLSRNIEILPDNSWLVFGNKRLLLRNNWLVLYANK